MNEGLQTVESNSRRPAQNGDKVVLEAKGLHKYYRSADSLLKVLRGVDFVLHSGEVVAIVGPSGSGKSTLLHVLGGLDRPTKGEVMLDSLDLSRLGDEELARVRNRRVGFVFQFHHLLKDFSALENVMMPLLIGGVSQRQARKAAEGMFDAVGLRERMHHKPLELSGGEQQRVAVSRALVHSPLVVLADEPTGNLDREHGEELQDLIFRMSEEVGVSFVIVTHNEEFASRADRIYKLVDGELQSANGV
jgi:lipoprotein-releasing system ATP-binding protein